MYSDFFNVQWTINETTRLSSSWWTRGDGLTVHAVAIKRLVNGKWEIDHNTAIEAVNPHPESDQKHEDFHYRWTHVKTTMVKAEYGDQEMPIRFYRDNLVTPNGRRNRGA